ncbi:MAG TPA: hypothetical protein PLR20_03390 [Syntrophales bacterium]|jgi:hypothetical protein|nr:hypothetical protein [Syntrophales bacterium]HOX93522.1 hypothetical protein [Syntrophales bacterium]HPI56009.1 hypothetical protein [Syntrophales bacterium]HPN24101.1 hypothetical protein [Syntrophales bacterium]HQM28380.1 hypothetical protein [Syntrophales bacterium]
MKKLVIVVSVFTALAFLVLPMGAIAQSQESDDYVAFMGYGLTVKKPKGFTRDNKASWDMVMDKKAKEPEKVYGIMVMQAANSADSIEIVFTNPCTYVRVGSTYYKKCK